MPIYTFKLIEHHQVDTIASDEFDTSDQEKWEWLKSSVSDKLGEDEVESLPEDAPSDPQIWFDLYRFLDRGEFAEIEDDWVSERKGGYDVSHTLTDTTGKRIISE